MGVERMKTVDEKYCKCGSVPCMTSGYDDGFGYWDVCAECGKKIEDGYHYYNHYDGEDHDDIDMY